VMKRGIDHPGDLVRMVRVPISLPANFSSLLVEAETVGGFVSGGFVVSSDRSCGCRTGAGADYDFG